MFALCACLCVDVPGSVCVCVCVMCICFVECLLIVAGSAGTHSSDGGES